MHRTVYGEKVATMGPRIFKVSLYTALDAQTAALPGGPHTKRDFNNIRFRHRADDTTVASRDRMCTV